MKTITKNFAKTECICKKFCITMLTIAIQSMAFAQTVYNNPAVVPLGTAGTYGALAYTGITGSANVNGDIGTSTATIAGTIIPSGTNWGVGGDHNTQAQTDLATALNNANGRTNDAAIVGDALGGLTLGRGVYGGGVLDLASGMTLTLNGSSTDVFIIKASSSLTINTGSTVALTGGAVWSNVFWYVGSSQTSLSGSTFYGIILSEVSITLNASATLVTAKLLAHNGAVTINSNVLPVELTSFTAELNKNAVALKWNTATEVNNYGFEIERSSINNNFVKIGFVQGQGNSNSPKEYFFNDTPIGGTAFKYRLKQIDFDGSYEFSNEIEVKLITPSQLTLVQNYPNPFNPSTYIEYSVPSFGTVILKTYDSLGREIIVLVNEEKQPGNYQVKFDGSNLSSGVYYYKLQFSNSVIHKKMLLIK